MGCACCARTPGVARNSQARFSFQVDDAPEVMEEEEEDTRRKSEVTVGKKQKARGISLGLIGA